MMRKFGCGGLAGTRAEEPEFPMAELEKQAGFGDRDRGPGKKPPGEVRGLFD